MSLNSSETNATNVNSGSANIRAIATPALGALIGVLSCAPFALSAPPLGSFLLCLGACALGAAVGYKRRNSLIFFYFSLVVACILATSLSNQMFGPAPTGFSEPAGSVTTQP